MRVTVKKFASYDTHEHVDFVKVEDGGVLAVHTNGERRIKFYARHAWSEAELQR